MQCTNKIPSFCWVGSSMSRRRLGQDVFRFYILFLLGFMLLGWRWKTFWHVNSHDTAVFIIIIYIYIYIDTIIYLHSDVMLSLYAEISCIFATSKWCRNLGWWSCFMHQKSHLVTWYLYITSEIRRYARTSYRLENLIMNRYSWHICWVVPELPKT